MRKLGEYWSNFFENLQVSFLLALGFGLSFFAGVMVLGFGFFAISFVLEWLGIISFSDNTVEQILRLCGFVFAAGSSKLIIKHVHDFIKNLEDKNAH